MIRLRPRSLAATAVSTAVLAGCGLVPKAGAAAEVNGEVLTVDQLNNMIDVPTNADGDVDWSEVDNATYAEQARSTIRLWVLDTVLYSEADKRGLPVTDLADDASLEDRANHVDDIFVMLTRDETDFGCVSIVVGEPFSMAALADTVSAGAPLAETMAAIEASGDVIAVQSGPIECFPIESLNDGLQTGQLGQLYAAYPESLELDGPGSMSELFEIVPPDGSQTLLAFSYFYGFDELTATEIYSIAPQDLVPRLIASSDIEVSSTYGAFDPETSLVVPLG